MLWVSKLILDAAGGLANARNGGSHGASGSWWRWNWRWPSLSDVLGRVNTLCDSLLGDRFTNRVSVRLMQHATRLDLASFEDPVFYDKLERARRQTTGRLGLLAAMLNLAQDSLSLVSLSAGLIVFSPWLMVLLVAAVIPAFLGETHFTHPGLLGALPLDAAAPGTRLPAPAGGERAERQGGQDLRAGRLPG